MTDLVREVTDHLRTKIKEYQKALDEIEGAPAPTKRKPASAATPEPSSKRRKSAPVSDADVLKLVETAGEAGIKAGAIRAALSADVLPSAVSVRLASLVDGGKLKKDGKSSGTLYRLVI